MPLFVIQRERTQIRRTYVEAPNREAAEAYANTEDFEFDSDDVTEYERVIRERVKMDANDQLPVPDAVVNEHGEEIDEEETEGQSWPYCDDCRSWHHPENPTCVLRKRS